MTRDMSGERRTPLVLIHGFTDTPRTWDLVRPALERRHDVLAPALAGHAGGPALPAELTVDTLPDALERAMDEAGLETAHLVGNSLGGYMALLLAARGRARSVVALAPAGGWEEGDDSYIQTLDYFTELQEMLRPLAPRAEELLASDLGRRRATASTTVRYEHIPVGFLAHQMRGVVAADVAPMIALAKREHYALAPERIECPVRFVWGTEDRLLPWPSAAARYRRWFPHADWVELEDVGHAPQLDVPLEAADLILGFTA
jgi:pimeloyl-ACP methyl ester carboxylesterase